MNKEKKWKIIAIIACSLLAIVVLTSFTYVSANSQYYDLCMVLQDELSSIKTALSSISSELSSIDTDIYRIYRAMQWQNPYRVFTNSQADQVLEYVSLCRKFLTVQTIKTFGINQFVCPKSRLRQYEKAQSSTGPFRFDGISWDSKPDYRYTEGESRLRISPLYGPTLLRQTAPALPCSDAQAV